MLPITADENQIKRGLLVETGELFIFQTRNIKNACQQSMFHVELSHVNIVITQVDIIYLPCNYTTQQVELKNFFFFKNYKFKISLQFICQIFVPFTILNNHIKFILLHARISLFYQSVP